MPSSSTTNRTAATTGWLPAEQAALARLAGTRGLARTRLNAYTDEIQVVAYDGDYLGRIRLMGAHTRSPRWTALPRGRMTNTGTYTNPKAAAIALARAAGRPA